MGQIESHRARDPGTECQQWSLCTASQAGYPVLPESTIDRASPPVETPKQQCAAMSEGSSQCLKLLARRGVFETRLLRTPNLDTMCLTRRICPSSSCDRPDVFGRAPVGEVCQDGDALPWKALSCERHSQRKALAKTHYSGSASISTISSRHGISDAFELAEIAALPPNSAVEAQRISNSRNSLGVFSSSFCDDHNPWQESACAHYWWTAM
jgi:hypothetical protein